MIDSGRLRISYVCSLFGTYFKVHSIQRYIGTLERLKICNGKPSNFLKLNKHGAFPQFLGFLIAFFI